MNVDTMRKVDYFLGVPLCFAGTLVRKLIELFASHKKDLGSKNILLKQGSSK